MASRETLLNVQDGNDSSMDVRVQDQSFHDIASYSNSLNKQIPVNTDIHKAINSMSLNQQSSLPRSPFFRLPPLLRSPSASSRMMEFVGSKLAAGSIKGSIFTMCISVIGAGMLALPYAVRNVGLILGIALVIFGAFLAYFTFDLLLISAEYLPEALRGPKPLRNISYQSLSEQSYGKTLGKTVQVLMAIQYWGCIVSYMVTFSGIIDLVYSIYPHPDSWPDTIYAYTVISMSYLIVLPLALLRNIDSLRFTSLLGFSMSTYLVLVVTIEYFILCKDGVTHYYSTTCIWSDDYKLSADVLWPMTTLKTSYTGFLTAFPLVIFSYTAHCYLLPLYVELSRPSIQRMRKVVRTGFSISGVLYICFATFGFLLFLDRVCSNLLLNNFGKHLDVVIGGLGMSITCILAEPIFAYNFRRMVGMLIWDKSTQQIGTFTHVLITLLVITVSALLAVSVKSIAVVFGFLGSTTYPVLGYIFPVIFFLKMTPSGKYKIRKILAVIQAIIVGTISLCSLIYKIYSSTDLPCSNAQTIG
eukprot:85055_1